MNILFVCKYNAFRSKVAESYFKKINKNKKIHASSAGFIKSTGADKTQKAIAKKLGAEIKGKYQNLSLSLIRKQDLVIIIAKDVPKKMFDHKEGYGKTKFEYWGIKDEQLQNQKSIEKIIKKIKNKVDKLYKKIK